MTRASSHDPSTGTRRGASPRDSAQILGLRLLSPAASRGDAAVFEGRDSVVVLPTGGGKSLCFQAPALAMPGLAVVVSPLISLMKDQVDALTDCGVPAACVNSTLVVRPAAARGRRNSLRPAQAAVSVARTADDRADYASFSSRFRCRSSPSTRPTASAIGGTTSGPNTARYGSTERDFPGIALHAYTATATERVREDIARELRLVEPGNPRRLVRSAQPGVSRAAPQRPDAANPRR